MQVDVVSVTERLLVITGLVFSDEALAEFRKSHQQFEFVVPGIRLALEVSLISPGIFFLPT
jgi:orotidine-5'-phosphate decarboxylase